MNRASDWKTYAAAAGATLAMATNASADIVNSGPVDVTVSIPSSGANRSSKLFTVNKYNEELVIGAFTTSVKLADAELFGSIGLARRNGSLYRYNAGSSLIGKSLSGFGLLRDAIGPGGVVTFMGGAFGSGTVSGFVGFELPDGDLGWMQVKVSSTDGFPDEAEVIDYAYNTVPAR